MTKVKNIETIRNENNRISGYRLQDKNGTVREMTSQELKRAIRERKIEVMNLKLTSDNRLIKREQGVKESNKIQPKAVSDDKISVVVQSGATFTFDTDFVFDITVESNEVVAKKLKNLRNSMVSIKIPKGVTKLESKLFHGCDYLQRVVMPNSVKSIGAECFMFCRNLQNIEIPDSVKEIGEHCFSHACESLTAIVSHNSYAEKYCKENNIKYKYH